MSGKTIASEPRPKLSDRAARAWAYYDGDQGAGQAMEEVQSILAESERATFGGKFVSNPGVYLATGWPKLASLTSPAGREIRLALAESLSNFVRG